MPDRAHSPCLISDANVSSSKPQDLTIRFQAVRLAVDRWRAFHFSRGMIWVCRIVHSSGSIWETSRFFHMRNLAIAVLGHWARHTADLFCQIFLESTNS